MTTKIALVGAGNISDQYLTNLSRYPEAEVVLITDIIEERAAEQAAKYGVPRSGAPSLAFEDLTLPRDHAAITTAALEAGKHVWSEKPLADSREAGKALVDLAKEKGLRLGCAPDTVLCPGVQGSLAALRAQEGEPFRARMLFQYHGPDAWHPNPEFLFKPGAGPLLDYGPYYLTTAVLALGPVKRVKAAVGITPREVREVGEGPLAGQTFTVEVPTTVLALLEHESGAVTDICFSFDSGSLREEVEFYTPGVSVIGTDPNITHGTVKVIEKKQEVFSKETDGEAWGRGVGLIDMIRSMAADEPHRASGDLAYHVLDVMLSIEEAIITDGPVEVVSTTDRVELIPEGWHPEKP